MLLKGKIAIFCTFFLQLHHLILISKVWHISAKKKCSVKMRMWLQVYWNRPAGHMKIICILVPLLLLLPPGCDNVSDLRAKSFMYRKQQRMSWTRAQAFCREHYTDLVTIRDESENLDSFQGWIGLYREDSASEWKWSRGDERANFTIWRRSKQGEHVPE